MARAQIPILYSNRLPQFLLFILFLGIRSRRSGSTAAAWVGYERSYQVYSGLLDTANDFGLTDAPD